MQSRENEPLKDTCVRRQIWTCENYLSTHLVPSNPLKHFVQHPWPLSFSCMFAQLSGSFWELGSIWDEGVGLSSGPSLSILYNVPSFPCPQNSNAVGQREQNKVLNG